MSVVRIMPTKYAPKALIVVTWVVTLLANLFWGSSEISWQATIGGFLRPWEATLETSIIWQIRIPRLVGAGLLGALMAAAGVLCQGLFRNPLASPSVLGTTSGATALVSLGFYLGLTSMGWWIIPGLAVSGALVSTLLIFGIALKFEHITTERLLLAGFALGALLSAIGSLMVSLSLADYQKSQGMFHWLMGSLSAVSWSHVWLLFPVVLVGGWLSWRVCAELDVLVLGEDVAATLGVSLNRLRNNIIGLIATMVGSAVAVGGGIGFIGLIVPHMTRLMIGSAHRELLIFSMLNGSTLLLLADLIARTAIQPAELQVGVLTALLGGSFFLYLLVKPESKDSSV